LSGCDRKEELRYYPDGRIRSKLNLKTGILFEYFRNGRLKSTFQPINDTSEGPYTAYYENGGVKAKTMLKGDKLNGTFMGFYPNGFLKIESFYEMGVLTGPVKMYYESGQLKLAGLYENDSLVYFKEYNEETREIIDLFRAFKVDMADTIFDRRKFEIGITEMGVSNASDSLPNGNMLHFDFISSHGDTTPYYRAFPIWTKVSKIPIENIPVGTSNCFLLWQSRISIQKKYFTLNFLKL